MKSTFIMVEIKIVCKIGNFFHLIKCIIGLLAEIELAKFTCDVGAL